MGDVGDGEGLLFPPTVVGGAELVWTTPPLTDDPPAEVGSLDVGRG